MLCSSSCSVVLFSSIDETEDGDQIVTNVLPARIKKMFMDITGMSCVSIVCVGMYVYVFVYVFPCVCCLFILM